MNDRPSETIFTKIINRAIPAHIIYEDEMTIAFLDIEPVRTGHTLVVPKIQIDNYLDLSPQDYTALFAAVRRVAQHLKSHLEVERVGLIIHGIDVPHAHVHLIPFNGRQSLHHDDSSPTLSPEEMSTLAERLFQK